jgi:hypothetical protein
MKTRKRPKGSVETFKGKNLAPADFDKVETDTEDFGSMIRNSKHGPRHET